ncbi:ATP-binding cassette domain-containing protein [Gulosibacter hominis]|uniref:ATP-binding cassette domain-containing protein n=1 Tax=Gulosibacter hominis TaxID=2770504 RepID=UPI001919B014|nr:ABC transporter ATP-binding protein [Gulosibacter hominis]
MRLITIDNLTVDYATTGGVVRALDGVDFDASAGERIAIVGESGSGKSTIGSAIGSLLPATARYASGHIEVDGCSVLELPGRELRQLRRDVLGYIPQDPIATLDPTKRIGKQLKFVVGGLGGDSSPAALGDLLERVRIRDPERVLRRFPHELSGGMAQRVAVALAIARREVLQLIFDFADEAGATVIWLSHDLEAVAKWCERVVVMYRGRVVEDGLAATVLTTPKHPYTQSLLDALPSRLDRNVEVRTYTQRIRIGEITEQET